MTEQPHDHQAREHAESLRESLEAVADAARVAVTRVEDARAQALFETSAEVCRGLATAMTHYQQQSEPAWTPGAGGDAGERRDSGADDTGAGVPAVQLDNTDLLDELASLHRTRHDTLRHAATPALQVHLSRMAELESEYLRRFPEREVDPARTR
jgi:hypothetical protein